MVGVVFFSEGLQKFIFPALMGGGRFARYGIPYPSSTSYVVATIELVGSVLLLAGIKVREAAWPLLAVIAGAFFFTKLPMLRNEGVWHFAHEARVDFCMGCGLIYLIHSYWRRGRN